MFVRKRTLSTATALAVLVSSAALVVGTAGSAAADSSKVLPLKSAGDIVVDGVHRKVFVSDPVTGRVVATDYSGNVLTTVPELYGVTGLALSADSGRLYAAVPSVDAIVALDTTTMAEQARYATGEGTDPQFLALAGGKIWFGYGTGADGSIGSLDVSGTDPVVALDQDAETDYAGAPRLAVSPTEPNTVAAAGSYDRGFALATYDVTTGTAARTSRNTSGLTGQTNDLAYTPDGKRIVTANPGKVHHVWQASDLTEVGTYTSTEHGTSVAIAPDGTVAAGSDAPYGKDVFVYRPGQTTAVRQYDFPVTGTTSAGDGLVNGGLAWEPGGSRLFAVTDNWDSNVRLHVLDEPTKSAPAVAVKAPATAALGKALTVSGTVSGTLALPVGTPLVVTRYDSESPKGKSLGTKKLAAKGAFSFTDTPAVAGNVTYKVAYAGSTTHSAASGSSVVKVAYSRTALKIDRNNLTVNYGTNVTYTATLGSTYKNRTVEIWADPWGPEPKRLLKRGKVNAKGQLATVLRMTRDTTVSAVFTGDARFGKAEAKSGVRTRAGVTTSLSGHYKWTKFGKTNYQTFHQTTDPLITTWINAYPGRYTRLDLEFYSQGRWVSGEPEYFPLDSAGKSYVTLDGDGAAGYRFRLRSVYVDGYNGDIANTTSYGPWKYFNFTK